MHELAPYDRKAVSFLGLSKHDGTTPSVAPCSISFLMAGLYCCHYHCCCSEFCDGRGTVVVIMTVTINNRATVLITVISTTMHMIMILITLITSSSSSQLLSYSCYWCDQTNTGTAPSVAAFSSCSLCSRSLQGSPGRARPQNLVQVSPLPVASRWPAGCQARVQITES